MRKIGQWMAFGCLLLLFAACEHKELCYEHPHVKTVRVAFDWTYAPNANPEGMCVFFYPVDSTQSVRRFDFSGKQGGQIEIEVGEYKVICYNNDTEAVLFKGTNEFETNERYTREGDIFESIYGSAANAAPRAKGAEDERVVISPDMMWGATAEPVVITDFGISYICVPEKDKDQVSVENSEYVITLYPREEVCTYTYEIINIQYLHHVTQSCGTLSGLSGNHFPVYDRLGDECVTVPFEAHSDGSSKITGKFYTFGHHPNNTEKHLFVLYVWLKDNAKYYYTFDVTDQVNNAPDKRHVHIVIDDLVLPKPIENGGGFNPSVDDWISEEHDILL